LERHPLVGRTCTRCCEYKTANNFTVTKAGTLSSWCGQCRNKWKREEYHPKNKGRHSEYMKGWYSSHKDEHNVRSRKIYEKNYVKAMWRSARTRAKNKGLPFDLKPEDLIIPDQCPALGIPLKAQEGSFGPKDCSPSLDRLQPGRGYVPDNVAIISNRANRIKSDATPEELRAVAAWLEKQLGERKQ
jgi:hypothetical protein